VIDEIKQGCAANARPKRSRPSNAGKGQRVIEPIEAPCADCMRKTLHDILHTTEIKKPDYVETFETIQCRGCSRVSLRETTVIKDDFAFYEKRRLVSPGCDRQVDLGPRRVLSALVHPLSPASIRQ
jgi:hypothetical protein